MPHTLSWVICTSMCIKFRVQIWRNFKNEGSCSSISGWTEGQGEIYDIKKSCPSHYINGLKQERRNCIANTLELRLSCTNPPISSWKIGENKKFHNSKDPGRGLVTVSPVVPCNFLAPWAMRPMELFRPTHRARYVRFSLISWFSWMNITVVTRNCRSVIY